MKTEKQIYASAWFDRPGLDPISPEKSGPGPEDWMSPSIYT